YGRPSKIYPNPAKTSITVEFDYEPINTTFQILDINGKILRHYSSTNKSKYEISILDFSPGVYFINTFNESNSLYFKFIKL
ncbi:MAG: T9SS type A sorting domain-containing protein, partial [Flavobacteriales bacterium]|nr:T9SS type A sorting domain-containing protein [Flavobacteriales bacterium]